MFEEFLLSAGNNFIVGSETRSFQTNVPSKVREFVA